ncbi:hypothetical protein Tco_0355234 [Tanacetum coccineum]
MPLSIKSQNDSFRFEHELKTEMHEDYEYVKSLEKEVDELESEKADFSNIYDLLLEECVSKDVTCSYLHSLSDLNAYAELQCLYLHKVKECECLAQKLSKQTESVNKEVHNKLLRDLKAQMQDKNIAISELKKLIEKYKGKSVETQTKKPKVVPISTSKPKRKANKSVATPHKKTVASDTTIQKSKSYYKELYENTNQEWKWWIAKTCPSGYTWTQKPLRTKKKWIPKIRKDDVSTSISPTIDIVSRITNIVQLILFIVDSGCIKHMTGYLKLLCNIVEKFLGTVRFGNDQFAPIHGYGDLNQGNVTIKRVYYVEGLNHNLFSVGQFCNADLEVAFRKSTCFVRDLQGNDLLTRNRGSDLYTISLQETTSSTPICFIAKASPTQACTHPVIAILLYALEANVEAACVMGALDLVEALKLEVKAVGVMDLEEVEAVGALNLVEGAFDLVEVEANCLVGALDVVGLSLNILISASVCGYLTSLKQTTSSSPEKPSSLDT